MNAFSYRAGLIVSVVLILDSSPGFARSLDPTAEQEIGTCIQRAALGQPWLEKTLWGLRDQEAGWIGAEVRNANGSHDLGPLQINSWWISRIAARISQPEAHVRHWLRFDPCFNAEAARWIFLFGLSASGSYWKAVGLYHSPVEWRQQRYVLSVTGHIHRRSRIKPPRESRIEGGLCAVSRGGEPRDIDADICQRRSQKPHYVSAPTAESERSK